MLDFVQETYVRNHLGPLITLTAVELIGLVRLGFHPLSKLVNSKQLPSSH